MAARKKKHLTPLEAIQQHCINCSGGVKAEVEFCCVIDCPLWPYRNGGKKEIPVETNLWDEIIEIED